MTIKHIIITGLILIGFVNSVKAENDITIEVTVKNNTKLDFNKGELSIMRTKTSPQKIKKIEINSLSSNFKLEKKGKYIFMFKVFNFKHKYCLLKNNF